METPGPGLTSTAVVLWCVQPCQCLLLFVYLLSVSTQIAIFPGFFAHLGLGFPMLEFGYSKTTWEACVEVTLLTCCSNAPAHRLYLGLECSQFFCSESELLLFSRALSLNLSLPLYAFFFVTYLQEHPSFLPDYKLTQARTLFTMLRVIVCHSKCSMNTF